MSIKASDIERVFDEKRYEDAVALADKRLVRHPHCRETRFLRAESLQALARFDEAFTEWTAIAVIEPDDSTPLYRRARLQASRGRFAEAIADFDRAERRDDGYFAGVIQMSRARCHMRLGDAAAAKKDIDAIPDDPDFDLLRQRLREELAKLS